MASLKQCMLGGLLFAFISYRIWRIVSLLFLSPLRCFPGPKLWACSQLPFQVSTLRGRPHEDLLRLHLRYGPVVRVAPDQLAFFTGQSFRDIYSKSGPRAFKKDRRKYQPPANGVDHLVCAIDDAEHARHRRLLAPGFTGEALKSQEPLVTRYVDALIQRLDYHSQSGPVNITDWLNSTTFDITGDLMFGESFGCLAEHKVHPWIQLLFDSIKALVFVGAVKEYRALDWLLMRLVPQSIFQKGVDHFNLGAEKADRRIKTGSKTHDFMSGILRNGFSEEHGPHLREEKTMSRAEVHSNAFILIIAGSETSASVLCGLVYYLCKSPESMQRLVTEVRTAFQGDEDISFNSTGKLSYLNAVIEEGLRVYPPLATGLSRVSPPGGNTVDGYFVPGGTTVATYHHATFHSPRNFYLPDDFIPERWLGDPRFANDDLNAVQAFSMGPRGCLGKNLAHAELRLVIAKLLFHFEVQLLPESNNWIDQDVYYLWKKPALMVNLAKRARSDSLLPDIGGNITEQPLQPSQGTTC